MTETLPKRRLFWCLVLGHSLVDDYTLENPLGRKADGYLCRRCGAFVPVTNGEDRRGGARE